MGSEQKGSKKIGRKRGPAGERRRRKGWGGLRRQGHAPHMDGPKRQAREEGRSKMRTESGGHAKAGEPEGTQLIVARNRVFDEISKAMG